MFGGRRRDRARSGLAKAADPLTLRGGARARAAAVAGEFKIRPAEVRDVEALSQLEKATWRPPLQGLNGSAIEERIVRFPAGQLVLLDSEGRIIGSLYTQRVASAAALHGGSFHRAIELHDDGGPLWQLVGIQIQPSAAQRGLATPLLERAFVLAKAAGVETVVAVTRCRAYGAALAHAPSLDMLDHAARGFCRGLSEAAAPPAL